jgi:DNA-directed RNA polymerase sigma subunit (sigma70/sigma32)
MREPLYSGRMTTQISEHIAAALAALREISDPLERERAARVMVESLLPDAARQAKAVRQEVVLDLRRDHTLREVAAILGVTYGRVDQLAKGK